MGEQIDDGQALDAAASSTARPITVIIVSYNTKALTLEAIRTLKRETAPDLFDLIVVDNASADGSAEAIAEEFPDLNLVALEENIGFASANNLAARSAKGTHVLLLNPDTEVLGRAVEQLYAFARSRPEARVWGGRTVFKDGTLNPGSCWNRMTLWSLFCLASGLKAVFPRSLFFNSEAIGAWQRDDVREVDIVSGCFLMMERSLWDELEGFNLDYFMYGEDADLCLRARKLGARPAITPEATIVHYGGASERVRSAKMNRLFKAKVTLMKHHWSAPARALGLALHWAFPLPRILGYGVANLVRKRESDKANLQNWIEVWSARRDWLAGYPASGDMAQ